MGYWYGRCKYIFVSTINQLSQMAMILSEISKSNIKKNVYLLILYFWIFKVEKNETSMYHERNTKSWATRNEGIGVKN